MAKLDDLILLAVFLDGEGATSVVERVRHQAVEQVDDAGLLSLAGLLVDHSAEVEGLDLGVRDGTSADSFVVLDDKVLLVLSLMAGELESTHIDLSCIL